MFNRISAVSAALLALGIFLNASFFSTFGSTHVDLSINLVASDALAEGVNPYGTTTLFERATALGSPTTFIYSQLFTSYIQPPTSGLMHFPLTALPWREATRTYLALNHLFLFAAVGITLYTLKPAIRGEWLLAGTLLILAAYSQIYASFALGQVDAFILLLLAVSFWAYTRGNLAPVAGGCVAIAAAIKFLPALLLLYFLWKREYRTVAWGIGTGVVLFCTSLVVVGLGTYEAYLTETLPALLKGSTHYTNIGLGGVVARLFTDGDGGEIASLSEVPASDTARLVRVLIGVGFLAALAAVIPRQSHQEQREKDAWRLLPEFYLVVAMALTISTVTWEFYVIWLLPVYLAAFLAPRSFVPPGPWRWLIVAGFVVSFVTLNYPGDCGQSSGCYLFAGNDFFYHPEWVPGVWAERQIGLYANHLDAVIYVRLTGFLLLIGLLSSIVLLRRAEAKESVGMPSEAEVTGRLSGVSAPAES